MRTGNSLLIPALLAASAASADNEIVGTVEMTLDGEEQTWYVLEPDGDMLSNAMWVAMGPGKGALAITAYESPDIEFVRHETLGSAVPDGKAAALVFSVAFPLEAEEYFHDLPAESSDGPAVIMLLADWSNPVDSFTLNDEPGEIRLTKIDATTNGPSAFSGTFHGMMRRGSGESMMLEDGRFDIEGARFFEGR